MDSLKEWIEPVLSKLDCELYDIEWDKSFTPPILRISVESLDGPTDLDTCARCSDAISEVLDEKDYSDKEYILEVCSPGAEKELKNDAAIQKALGSHVFVKLKDPKEGLDSVTGTLSDVSEDTITVSYHLKGRPKKITIDKSNIAFIRNAVKL